MKEYKVTLTADERQSPRDLIAAGKAAAKRPVHARILLKVDAAPGGPAWTDERIAEAVEVNPRTVGRVRRRFVEDGLEAALVREKQDRPSRERKLDGDGEARPVAVARSQPPQGRGGWTPQLLADKPVEPRVVDPISDETVRRVLKKTNSSRGRGSNGASRRRRVPSSSARWRTCWRSTTGPSTGRGRRSAWTRRASS